MSTQKIYLGCTEYGTTYIKKHKWNYDWCWTFGYLGNFSCHFHIESLINHPEKYDPGWTNVVRQFSETWLTQKQWWILRDLFIQAYALKKAAACYRYGGHQTENAAPHRITSSESADALNIDLEALLDNIWNLLTKWKENKQ